MFSKRTDLALDAAEYIENSQISGENGYKKQEYQLFGLPVTKITINSPSGSKLLNKKEGDYITINLPEGWENQSDVALSCAKAISKELTPMLPTEGTVLVVGLGNYNVTADSVGPIVTQNIIVTRHLKENMPKDFVDFHSVTALAPGVLGLTGIETGEIVKGVCDKIAPVAIIAVDALATTDTARLCRTIQITDTGITPGSGVGNPRFTFDYKSFGIPVIALGIPTVIDANTLCTQALETHGIDLPYGLDLPLIVTPKDIDKQARRASKLIASALNMTLHENIDSAFIQEFIG